MRIHGKPYEHQVEAFQAINRIWREMAMELGYGVAALLMEMGTGKTLPAIAIVDLWRNIGEMKRWRSLLKGGSMLQQMFDTAERLKALREHRKELTDLTKANNEAIDEAEQALAELMIQTETQSFNRAGTMFYLQNKLHVNTD